MNSIDVSAIGRQCDFLRPLGGLERLRDAGVVLTPAQLQAIFRLQLADVDPAIPVVHVWPSAVEALTGGGFTVTGISKCCLCNRLHLVPCDNGPALRVRARCHPGASH